MDNQREEKALENKNYIDNHRENVSKAYQVYGEELCNALDVDPKKLAEMVREHDMSKYSQEEFEGYRMNYYPTDEEKADLSLSTYKKKMYESAWLHHLRNNAHHPEFWMRTNDDGNIVVEDMDKIHIAEMLLDWESFAFAGKDSAYEYWSKRRHDKPFSRNTDLIVANCIDIFKRKPNL